MSWTFDFSGSDFGIATHEPTGASFMCSVSGYFGVRDSGSACSKTLKLLLEELRAMPILDPGPEGYANRTIH